MSAGSATSSGSSGVGTRRCVVVGTGSRAWLYLEAFTGTYRERVLVVGLCDPNETRLALAAQRVEERQGERPLVSRPGGFAELLRDSRATTVVVTSVDRTHPDYSAAALDAGCEVICEKPLAVDAPSCCRILEATRRAGRHLKVTLNARYMPRNAAVAGALQSGVIGQVRSAHFEWLLDTNHGADYFRRWHRDKRNSGGLIIHKASHHFDLMNWWLGDHPAEIMGYGDLVFYGRANAEQRGVKHFYDRSTGNPSAEGDPFALDLSKRPELRRLYLDAEKSDGYLRDRSVFSDGISIEDDMALLIRYRRGTTVTYHLTAYSPWEGYRVAFNGTAGRLEFEVAENAYAPPSTPVAATSLPAGVEPAAPAGAAGVAADVAAAPERGARLILRRHWEPPVMLALPDEGGPHAGGDERLLAALLDDGAADPLGQRADEVDGAAAALIGMAANRSFATGRPVEVTDLVPAALWSSGVA